MSLIIDIKKVKGVLLAQGGRDTIESRMAHSPLMTIDLQGSEKAKTIECKKIHGHLGQLRKRKNGTLVRSVRY